jgi:DNA mismatch repair protein MutL
MPPECRIRILEEDVANKIAAGEVVERPASVVKELVENAVDAGATRVIVEVEEGGKKLIRVTDNGCGMTAQEAVLALQRHATSKISRAEDLAAVRTLGFRGEALPSVASVSRLTILTRARGELEGVRLEADAGEIRELEPAGAAEGSIITIRDLFYNTPARLKFLKTNRTELGQICDTLTRLALSHPGITVRLIADEEESLHAPGSPDPLNTITALYGKDLARELLPVSYSRSGLAVEGYVSRPTLTRPTRSGQHLFVNGRWVRNRTLTHALDEAYRATMHPGRFPFAVLHVEIDPALVDVNVHPTKAEVRFLREWEVHRALFEAVRQALGTTEPALASEPLARQQTLGPEALRGGPWLPTALPIDPSDPFAGGDPGADIPPHLRGEPPPQFPGYTPENPVWSRSPYGGAGPALSPEAYPPLPPEAAPQLSMPELQVSASSLRPIAQLWNSYILTEGPTGLLVIDQHLAHERVLFDRLQAAGAEEPAVVQRLAVPVTLQLIQREAVMVEELLPELARIGFELEAFGRHAFVVRAVPAFVSPGVELATLRGLLDELMENRGASPHEEATRSGAGSGRAHLPDRVAATAACKAAVKKGSRLGVEEIRQLLEDLARTANPHTCPHGCPIAVEISYQELLRRFKRI